MKVQFLLLSLLVSSSFCLPDGTWTKIAGADEDFTIPLPGFRIIRYGDGTNWRYLQDSAYGTCSRSYFGWYGPISITECQLFTPTDTSTVPTKPKNGGPLIDITKIPPGNPGFSDLRIKETDEQPAASGDGIGAFRISCEYSHMLFDDPIVFPGQPGESHLHMFFGNKDVNANSNTESIANTGDSSCPGGIMNRSGYWVAPLIDTRDGTPLMSTTSIFYYKTGYYGIAANWVQDPPPGLRMIAGNAKAMTSDDAQGTWECQDDSGSFSRSNKVVNCPVGSRLHAGIDFPQCWDGVNLDSPDHKSHMSFPVNGKCPPTHPVAIPVITININWAVKEKDAPLHWRLSSDMYDTSMPGGYSYHADWWNGWNQTILHQWMDNCDRAPADCHAHLLGNNQMFYGF
jgi:hypothetical protein